MLKLIIEDDEGRKIVHPFLRDELTIGRHVDNTIRLDERNVSRRHARFRRAQNVVILEDLSSYNGVKVNGERIMGQIELHAGDLIQIGDFDLAIEYEESKTLPGSIRPTTEESAVTSLIGTPESDSGAWNTPAPTIPAFEAVPTSVEPTRRASILDSSPSAQSETLSGEMNTFDQVPTSSYPTMGKARQGKKAWGFVLLGILGGGGLFLFVLSTFKKTETPEPTHSPPSQSVQNSPSNTQTPTILRGSTVEKIASAKIAIQQREWDKAKDLLDSCIEADGHLAEGASLLLQQMGREADWKKNVDLAEKALNAKDFEGAKKFLDASAKTELLAVTHLELTARWEDEKPRPVPVETAATHFDQGVELFKKDKLSEARKHFDTCLKLDPKFASCHKALGGVHAKLGNTEKGFFHYKEFVKRAPNDQDAEKVQAIIDAYEKSKNEP